MSTAAWGSQAVEHLRLICAELQIDTVRSQVALSLFTDFGNFSEFKPADIQMQALSDALSQTVAWSEALQYRPGWQLAHPRLWRTSANLLKKICQRDA